MNEFTCDEIVFLKKFVSFFNEKPAQNNDAIKTLQDSIRVISVLKDNEIRKNLNSSAKEFVETYLGKLIEPAIYARTSTILKWENSGKDQNLNYDFKFLDSNQTIDVKSTVHDNGGILLDLFKIDHGLADILMLFHSNYKSDDYINYEYRGYVTKEEVIAEKNKFLQEEESNHINDNGKIYRFSQNKLKIKQQMLHF